MREPSQGTAAGTEDVDPAGRDGVVNAAGAGKGGVKAPSEGGSGDVGDLVLHRDHRTDAPLIRAGRDKVTVSNGRTQCP